MKLRFNGAINFITILIIGIIIFIGIFIFRNNNNNITEKYTKSDILNLSEVANNYINISCEYIDVNSDNNEKNNKKIL